MLHLPWIKQQGNNIFSVVIIIIFAIIIGLLAQSILVSYNSGWNRKCFFNFWWHENCEINTMQHYKYQLSAPSSTETLIPAVRRFYLFEPKGNIMSAEEERNWNRERKRSNQNM